MKTFEYNPFDDIYIPYIVSPGLAYGERARLFWEIVVATSNIPFLTRWVIYKTLRDLK